MTFRIWATLGSLALLAGCASTPPPAKPAPPTKPGAGKPAPAKPAPRRPVAPMPAPQPGSELDRVIGKDARALVQLFGTADADVREGAAQRLQFGKGRQCIIDVYLYPPASGKTPVATYVAARTPDGRDAERNSCIGALRRN